MPPSLPSTVEDLNFTLIDVIVCVIWLQDNYMSTVVFSRLSVDMGDDRRLAVRSGVSSILGKSVLILPALDSVLLLFRSMGMAIIWRLFRYFSDA